MFPKKKRIVDASVLDMVRKRNCEVCGKRATAAEPSQACHIRSRGAGGDDTWENIYAGCAECHHLQHLKGFAYMFEKYPFFKQVVYHKGWYLDGNKKLRR
jgi:5-methylcytosine-specific restriction endonuclease McrA